ncbi:MAG: Fe(2+)-trafficking protein [Planctomycetes bacterium]|nr:Fe(2+)-trafficking protein [Planctomycetota bacterium]
MDIAQRIAQFENMVAPGADPDNDMAWFSLAGAYAQAGRHADAARAYQRCIAINPDMSKAYQLAGKAFADAGDTTSAVEVLTGGYRVAAARGDFMPKKAIGELLTKLGAPVPQVEEVKIAATATGGTFICQRTGKAGTKMARPPFRGPVGAWIAANISNETWGDWIRQGTKVINELRLDLSRDEDGATYERHMRDYLGIDDALLAELNK